MDEFVFLLPRPKWQADEQANICNRCHARFSLFIRKVKLRFIVLDQKGVWVKDHLETYQLLELVNRLFKIRQMTNDLFDTYLASLSTLVSPHQPPQFRNVTNRMFSGLVHCHHCCSRKTPLRQLGYLEQVRVCESCFEFAYLISYVLHYESKSTQELDHLKTMLVDPNSSQRHGRTFGVLIRTITTILDIYLLVPEVQGDDIGVHSIQRIIFNAVMTGARLVFLLCSYPSYLNQIIQSRWLYLFLDAIEQAFQDGTFHSKSSPKLVNFLPDGQLSKSDCLSLRGVFEDELRSQQGQEITATNTRRARRRAAPQDDIWMDALELQVVASGTICMLCELVCKETSIRFDRHEVRTRIEHLLELYPDPNDPEVFHFQPGLSAAIKNLNQTIQILEQPI